MSSSDQSTANTASGNDWFGQTHWSVVLQAGEADSATAQSALASLCKTYWYPLYVFIRRQGHNPEDAKDLVQGFFAKVIEKNYLASVEPEKGRFRSFLLIALKRFMANEWDRVNRKKRGGGQEIVSLDEQNTELRYRAEPMDQMSPDKAFERQWALTLLQQVLDRLASESAKPGKAQMFGELKVFLSGEKSGSYAEAGARLGMTEAAVKVAVHRLRQRYRELLREEIANTVSRPEEVDDEIRNLFAALS